jgi:hypothetical protein
MVVIGLNIYILISSCFSVGSNKQISVNDQNANGVNSANIASKKLKENPHNIDKSSVNQEYVLINLASSNNLY